MANARTDTIGWVRLSGLRRRLTLVRSFGKDVAFQSGYEEMSRDLASCGGCQRRHSYRQPGARDVLGR